MKFRNIAKLALATVLAAPISYAAADHLCVEKFAPVKNGKINIPTAVLFQPNACTGKYAEVTAVTPEFAGFAKVSESDAVLAFGGNDVSSIHVTGNGGAYTVSFIGVFPGLTSNTSQANINRVQLMVTPISVSYAVASAFVNFATSTEIDVTYFTWSSNTNTESDLRGANIAFLISPVFAG